MPLHDAGVALCGGFPSPGGARPGECLRRVCGEVSTSPAHLPIPPWTSAPSGRTQPTMTTWGPLHHFVPHHPCVGCTPGPRCILYCTASSDVSANPTRVAGTTVLVLEFRYETPSLGVVRDFV